MATDTVTLEFLKSFGDAWNRRDLEPIMAHLADDCAFLPAVTPDLVAGGSHGHADVRRGVQAFLDAWPDGDFESLGDFIAGNRDVSEWIFTGTKADGTKLRARGCDVFTFAGGKIEVEDAFRTQLP